MPRELRTALHFAPLLFEPVPPTVRSNPVRAGLQTEELVRRLRAIPRLDALNVPELVDENHDGRPYYRTGDPRTFALTIGEPSGCELIVNKVVAHLESAAALEAWASETLERGVKNVVLVGGSSRYIPYPGPPVLDADRICAGVFGERGGLVGNIAIPQRTGEAHRMLAKTRAGAAFFTTQIVFDSDSAARMIREYGRLCRQASVAPAAVLVSLAPLADETDAEFVRWLGADIPETAEKLILNGEDSQAGARSVRHALGVWAGIRERAGEANEAVPLGVNVEQISQRHLVSALEMLLAFARVLEETGPQRAG